MKISPLSSSDSVTLGCLLSAAPSDLGALGCVGLCEDRCVVQIFLLIELFPRKAGRPRHTFRVISCYCTLPTAIAALSNQRCLRVLLFQGTRDPLFLTGVTFPSEYPIYEETKIKLTVYDVKDKSHDTVSTFLLPLGKGAMLFQTIGFGAFFKEGICAVFMLVLRL